MRAAIYLRVSTEDQVDKFGLDIQRDRCEAMAAVKGWKVVTTLADEGLSGSLDVAERPALAALLAAAEAGAFDAVIVAALDRLGRQSAIILNIAAVLESLGVELVSCRESLDTSTPAGQFVLTVFAGLAQLDKDNIRERMIGGIEKSIEAGNIHTGGSNAPFGYDVGEVNGKRTLVINEEEAEIVRLMFEKYARGEETIHSLAAWLTERNVPKPGKNNGAKAVTQHQRWGIGTIAHIFSNETYIGNWYYRKTKRVKQPDGSYRNEPRPRSQWLHVEVPAIIDRNTFDAVQRRRKANKREMSGRRTHVYALGGMLTCGHCNDIGMAGISRHDKTKTMGERVYSYYICNRRHSRKRYGGKCELPPVNATALEATVWDWVSKTVMTPGKLRVEWERYRQGSLDGLQPALRMIEANEKKLAGLREAKQRLVKAYREGVLSLDELAADKTDIERTISQYEAANASLRADLEARAPAELDFDMIEDFVAELELGAEEATEDAEIQAEIYRALQLQGVVTYEEGEHWVTLTCVLGKPRLPVEYNTRLTTGVGKSPPAASRPGSSPPMPPVRSWPRKSADRRSTGTTSAPSTGATASATNRAISIWRSVSRSARRLTSPPR